MADTYSADALRMALIFGSALGNDLPMSEDKIRAMRNFTNKLWNMARFIKMNSEFIGKNNAESITFSQSSSRSKLHPDNKNILDKTDELIKSVTSDFE